MMRVRGAGVEVVGHGSAQPYLITHHPSLITYHYFILPA